MSNQLHQESNSQGRTVRIHVPQRRTSEERRLARSLGVDALGRPTARRLGIEPRKLVRDRGLTMPQALKLSRELLEKAYRELGYL